MQKNRISRILETISRHICFDINTEKCWIKKKNEPVWKEDVLDLMLPVGTPILAKPTYLI